MIVVWLILAASQGAVQASPERDYRAIRRAVFLTIYPARLGPRTAPGVIDALGKLDARFGKSIQSRLRNDIPALLQLRSSWLNKYRKAATAAARAWNDNPRNRVAQGIAPFYVAALPAEIALRPDDKAGIDGGLVDAELAFLVSRLMDDDLKAVVLRDFVYGKLEAAISRKTGRLAPDHSNPDLGFQILRWAVFQYIGQIAGDQAALDQALGQLDSADHIVMKNRSKVMADLPRIIRLRRTWLNEIVLPALDRAPGNDVTVRLPSELGIEAGSDVIATELRFDKTMRGELELELELLGNPKATLDSQLPGGTSEKAVNAIRARLILDTLAQHD